MAASSAALVLSFTCRLAAPSPACVRDISHARPSCTAPPPPSAAQLNCWTSSAALLSPSRTSTRLTGARSDSHTQALKPAQCGRGTIPVALVTTSDTTGVQSRRSRRGVKVRGRGLFTAATQGALSRWSGGTGGDHRVLTSPAVAPLPSVGQPSAGRDDEGGGQRRCDGGDGHRGVHGVEAATSLHTLAVLHTTTQAGTGRSTRVSSRCTRRPSPHLHCGRDARSAVRATAADLLESDVVGVLAEAAAADH